MFSDAGFVLQTSCRWPDAEPLVAPFMLSAEEETSSLASRSPMMHQDCDAPAGAAICEMWINISAPQTLRRDIHLSV